MYQQFHDAPFHFIFQFLGVWGEAVGKNDWNIFIEKAPEYLTEDFILTNPTCVARDWLFFETKGVAEYVDRLMHEYKLTWLQDRDWSTN